MVCRHSPGDPACGQDARNNDASRMRDLEKRIKDMTPDPAKYEIVEVERVGKHLVMKVNYQGCVRCTKVMVFLNVQELDAVRWRKIDPHFGETYPGAASHLKRGPREAPSPAARFPATTEGWNDALTYASWKDR